jgi:transcriptional regulator with XRE-family HTH domain
MITHMRTPTDEFARRLRELRREHGFTADRLSVQCGVAKSYIGRWEREPCLVNREILQRVAEALELPAVDRKELFRLADLRNAPDAAKEIYRSAADPDEILFGVLMELDHHWPEELGRSLERTHHSNAIVDALGWAILRRESRVRPDGGDATCARADWPDAIAVLGFASTSGRGFSVPLDVVRQEVPQALSGQLPSTEADSEAFFLGLARAYRRAFFADVKRAREAARVVIRWEYARTQGPHGRLFADFKPELLKDAWDESEPPAEFYDDIEGVTCPLVAETEHRAIAQYMRSRACQHLRKDPLSSRAWKPYFRSGSAELAVLQTVAMAEMKERSNANDFQDILDARYIVASRTWFQRDCVGDGSLPAIPAEDWSEMCENGRISDAIRGMIATCPDVLENEQDLTAISAYLGHFYGKYVGIQRQRATRCRSFMGIY